MINFYVVRHGQTLLNYLKRTQGWVDSPLTGAGKQAALALGHKLRKIDFQAVYTSDMPRAAQTAELILAAGGKSAMPMQKEARLREWCLGSLEAEDTAVFLNRMAAWIGDISSFAELNQQLPQVAAAVYEHDTTGMAESFLAVTNRLKSLFGEIAQNNYQKGKVGNVLIVTHAFVIKTLLYLFAPERLKGLKKINNADVYRFTFDGQDFALAAGTEL